MTALRRYFLVLPAAGAGLRMSGDCPKQYRSIHGKSSLQHCLEGIGSMPLFNRIILALSPRDQHWPEVQAALAPAVLEKVTVVTGGSERAASVAAALTALAGAADANDWVLVHDAVRPLVRASDVERLVRELAHEPAGGLLAVPVRDTLKSCTQSHLVSATVDRKGLWQAQTPQMFRYGVLSRALGAALASRLDITDEAAAVEALALPVRIVAGSHDNFKITYEDDLQLATLMLAAQDRGWH